MAVRDFRKDFPIFEGSDYIYFDNAATSQRPRQVIEAIDDFYKKSNANPLRGLYDLSVDATNRYEGARDIVARFLNADKSCEIIFTRNTTESMNLIAYSYGLSNLKEGDEIVISVMEHHSNILPWQMVCKKTGAKLVYLEIDDEGVISKEEYEKKITKNTKIVSIGHVSNVMGVTNPIKEISDYAHKMGAVMVVDGAQSAPHMKVDVKKLGADFFAFSGHKLMAPMGIGVLYVKKDILDNMDPFLTGGEMIEYVTRYDATWAELPHKFEAGTVNAAGAVGLGRAIEYLEEVGFDYIADREHILTKRMMDAMNDLKYIKIYGSKDPGKHCGIVTFVVDGVHPHDTASILNEDHVCIRAGHHCAQPLMQFLNVGSTARASLYFYNTEEEVDRFIDALSGVRKVMGYGD